MGQQGLFGLFDYLERLSDDGDPLELLERTVDFECFRPWLLEGLSYDDGRKGGRPPYDPVSMLSVLTEYVPFVPIENVSLLSACTPVRGHAPEQV